MRLFFIAGRSKLTNFFCPLKKPPHVSISQISGTESDSDSILTPDVLTSTFATAGPSGSAALHGTPQPLSSIAERRSVSGEDSEDEEDEEEGGWKSADIKGRPRGSVDEVVIKAGYLWKKGERRKV